MTWIWPTAICTRKLPIPSGISGVSDEWVFGVKDRTEYVNHYIQKIGYAQYKKLQAKFDYGYPVSYTY
jgi:glutaconate CoA-transferase subunit A